jgi:hypothetical protein
MNRTRPLLAAACALAIAAALAPAAIARGSSFETLLTIEGAAEVDSTHFETFGVLDAGSKHCVAGRTVKLSAQVLPGDPYKPFDTATASSNGGWAGVEHTDVSPNSIKAVAPKFTYGRKGHRKTCRSASEKFTPDK